MTGKDISKITLNLVIIYIIGGLLIAGVYAKTSPIIFQIQKKEKEQALQRMMPVQLIANAPAEAEPRVKELLPRAAEVSRGSYMAEVDILAGQLDDLIDGLEDSGATTVAVKSDYRPVKAGDWEPWHKHAEHYEVMKDGEAAGYIVETYGKGYSSYINVLVAVDPDFTVRKINILHQAETPGLGDEIMTEEFMGQYRGKDLDHLEVIKGETEDKIQALTGATISSRAVTSGVRDGVEMLREKYAGVALIPGEAEEEGHAGRP
ncbi:MAG: FMN-binding protein [Nitrospirota bacterium]|jgi:electron transport complex protein RnfG